MTEGSQGAERRIDSQSVRSDFCDIGLGVEGVPMSLETLLAFGRTEFLAEGVLVDDSCGGEPRESQFR